MIADREIIDDDNELGVNAALLNGFIHGANGALENGRSECGGMQRDTETMLLKGAMFIREKRLQNLSLTEMEAGTVSDCHNTII